MTDQDAERLVRMALSCVVEGGSTALGALLQVYQPAELWEALRQGKVHSGWSERARDLRLESVVALAERHKVRFVIPGDEEWPDRLDELEHCDSVQDLGGAPLGIWLCGARRLTECALSSVAIVGSRAATAYGESVASEIAADLARNGITIVSGGAYGIDAAAHRGALAVDGPTVAVLAGGLDNRYPPRNRALLDRIAAEGLLISEQPPGMTPTRMRFLTRNRLIAALAGGVLIVEAAMRSGARNTVSWALACGRPVMAVPGSVHSVTAQTPHRLIRDGEAILTTSARDVLDVLGPLGQAALPICTGPARPVDALPPEEFAVYEALPARGALDAGEIALRAGIPVQRCLGSLSALAAKGFVSGSGGLWQLAR